MKINMNKWLEELKASSVKKALPILSFPSVGLLGCSVREITADSSLQAQGMKLVADKTNSAASVSLMDLSVEAECFGAKAVFSDDEVPTIAKPLITDPEEVYDLVLPEVGTARSGVYIDAIKKSVELICDRPIFAGVIGPYSLAARLMDMEEIMINCYDEPEAVHALLEICTEFIKNYCLAFKEAGANGVMMAEPVAGLLSPALAEEFSAPYVKQVVDAVQDEEFLLIYHNCGDKTPLMLDSILSTGAAAYHFGNAIDMAKMMEKMPPDLLTMGNIDPAGILRNGTPETVKAETQALLEKCSKYPNFIPSSGCDIPPQTPWENIDTFFKTVDDFYGKKEK